jgi:hypothetical protein
LNEFFLTFDVDWAADAAIDDVAELLIARGLKATWFVTHEGEAVDRLRRRPDLFELGVHPNFLPGSTHGATPEAVLEEVLRIVPEAVSFRPHSVVYSGRLLELIMTKTQLRIDSTFLLPGVEGIRPFVYRQFGGELTRVPFFWADDYELGQESPDWNATRFFALQGLKVLDFHPIHVWLNSGSAVRYQEMRSSGSAPSSMTSAEGERWRATGRGARTFLFEILDQIERSGQRTRCLREIEADGGTTR